MAAYFLSDIHLKPFGDARLETLCQFLDSINDPGSSVYLMGDIFDFWMGGHKIWQKRYQSFVDSIQKLISRDVKVVFFEGNHDIHIHPFYRDVLGCEILTDPEIRMIEGLRVRLEHGDLFNPDDRGYIFLRKFLRSYGLKQASIHAPGALVAAIADWGSRTSHKRSSREGRKPEVVADIKRRTRIYVEKCAQEVDFDLMVMGHTHVREDYVFSINARRVRFINLGSWFESAPKVLRLKQREIDYLEVT